MNNKLVDSIIPKQPQVDPQSDVHVLKSRLEWGKPAFTILDVRDRMTYNQGHIMGAMPMQMDELVERALGSNDYSVSVQIYL
jgi:rhodanese-related sulfurtransferase